MSPQLRQTLLVAGSTALAVWMGFAIADGNLGWPIFLAALTLAAALSRLLALPFDAILVGLVLAGFILGNRGFAQQMLIPNVPLLPAEIALLVAGSWRFFVWGFDRRLPLRRSALDWAVLAWLILGSARFLFDFPRHGLLAARDFAIVYYAAFFFIVRHLAATPRVWRYLDGCILAAFLGLPLTYALSTLLPGLLFEHLSFHGAPLIFFKDDLAITFFAVGSVHLYFRSADRYRIPCQLLAVGYAAFVLARDNRASVAGLGVAAGLLLAARRWPYPALLGVIVATGLIGLGGLASVGQNDWARDKLQAMADRAVSLVDFSGHASYSSQESGHKGDNNRFRLVWWKNVAEETWQRGPVFGLGFGEDLAAGFLREYYPDSAEDFTTRSPHNIHMTVFGRLGLAGITLWLGFCAILLQRTWRTLRSSPEPAAWATWCGLCIVLASASFGVVLEGPMGGVFFWSLLGLADASSAPKPVGAGEEPATASP